MKKGFTLIELIVALSILVILIVIGLVIFSNVQKTARDSKRKQDIRAISRALDLYYFQNKSFPSSPDSSLMNIDSVGLDSTNPAPWIPGLVPDFISEMPVDPVNLYDGANPNTKIYGYFSNNPTNYDCPQSQGRWYLLAAILEKPNDPESLAANPNLYLCDGVHRIIDTEVGAALAPYLYVIADRK